MDDVRDSKDPVDGMDGMDRLASAVSEEERYSLQSVFFTPMLMVLREALHGWEGTGDKE